MKTNYLSIILFALAFIFLAVGCKQKKEEKKPEKMVSFDLEDSAMVDELLCFYLDSAIIPEEAFVCDHHKNGGRHTFDCISENVDFCVPNYMQDSLHGTFFEEIGYQQGSSGDNNIYICERTAKGFRILFSTPGTTDADLGPENEFVNGYRVLYFRSEDRRCKLYYDGKKFVIEDLDSHLLSYN